LLPAILGLGQICSWGTLYYSFPLIVTRMELELGWSKSELYAGATIGLLMTALLSYPVGVGIDRGWGRWIMAGASLAAMGVFGWWSVTDQLLSFYIICALSGAIQAAVLYEPSFAVLARRMGSGQSRAGITHITLWGGFASTVFVPITGFLISAYDWRVTLLILGLVNVCYGLVYFLTIQPQKDIAHSSDPSQRQADRSRDQQVVRENLRSSLFWLVLLSLTMYAGVFSAFTFHMYPLLQANGLSEKDVVIAIAIIGPAQVLGRILITVFARGAPVRLIGSVLVAAFPIVFALLIPMNPSFWLVAVVFAVYGLTNGIFTIVRGLVVPEMLSPHAYGALNGIITIAATIARAVTPLIAAWIWAIDNAYQPVVLSIFLASLFLAATFWLAAWRSRSSD